MLDQATWSSELPFQSRGSMDNLRNTMQCKQLESWKGSIMASPAVETVETQNSCKMGWNIASIILEWNKFGWAGRNGAQNK